MLYDEIHFQFLLRNDFINISHSVIVDHKGNVKSSYKSHKRMLQNSSVGLKVF